MQEKSFCGFFFSYSPDQRRKTRQSKKNLPKHFEKKNLKGKVSGQKIRLPYRLLLKKETTVFGTIDVDMP